MLGTVERVVTAVVLAVVVLGIAWVAQRRRRPDAPVRTGFTVPPQLDRQDFDRPDAAWLVAVFTSATCDSCQSVWDKARHLASDEVAVQELEVTARKDVHDRYGIDAVPTTIVADAAGVVRQSFLGPVTATDLWAAVAELREPGSTPGGCT
jgi:thioredoxin family protein